MPRSSSQIRSAFPVPALDLAEEEPQGPVVGDVAGQDLVRQGEALGGDDERDDELHAVAPLVPAVAKAALIVRVLGGTALEVGAGQVVEQDLVGAVEQIAPPLGQVGEEGALVREQAAQAPVELVDLHQLVAGPEQVGHRTLEVPLTVQPPLAARVEEPVGAERRQDQVPAGAFAAGGQARGPEGVQPQLGPEVARQPAGAPLAWPPDSQILQPDLHDRVVGEGGPPVLGEQGDRAGLRRAVLEHLDGLAPGLALAVVDLAQVEHAPLHHAPAGDPAALDDAPVPVELAVFLARVTAQEHSGVTLPLSASAWKRVGLHYKLDRARRWG
jgi:hypothetical protein